MIGALASTALLMGLAGGPHCVAMCGAGCAGIGRAAGKGRHTLHLALFQLGRIGGYSALGALAGTSMQGLGWLTVQTAAIRPVWTLFHVALMVLGLVLMWRARQPLWLEVAARTIWRRLRGRNAQLGPGATVALGASWAFMPCGLLYSALLVAALAGKAVDGAAVMALFAVGSSVSLFGAPWLLQKIRGGATGATGVRLAGLALMAASGWALWHGLVDRAAPWCLAP